MCLVDDGSGTGTKVARYYVDTDGNYYELYSYVLFSPNEGILETASFTLKVALGAPGKPNTTPATSETPNNGNPQDLASQINTVSALVFTAFGPSASGQPPAYLPIQAAATPRCRPHDRGPPDFGGYDATCSGNRRPVRIAGPTPPHRVPDRGDNQTVPLNAKQKPVPFYGSLAYGLDEQTGGHGGPASARTGTPSACVPRIRRRSRQDRGGQAEGAFVAGDDAVAYTVNAPFIDTTASAVMDSTGKAAGVGGHQVSSTGPTPKTRSGGTYLPTFVLTRRRTMSSSPRASRHDAALHPVSGRSEPPVRSGNTQATVDTTTFTFNAVADGAYTVTYAAADAPATAEAPTPSPSIRSRSSSAAASSRSTSSTTPTGWTASCSGRWGGSIATTPSPAP